MSHWRDQGPLDCKVYVGNLGSGAAKHELERAFEQYGPVQNVWVARNPPGFAYIEFEDYRDAEDAVRGLDGRRICKRRVRVELAKGKQSGNRGYRGGGGGAHYSRGGGGGGGGGRYPSPQRRNRYSRSRSRSVERRRRRSSRKSRSHSRERRYRSKSGERRSRSRSRSRSHDRHHSRSSSRDRRSRSSSRDRRQRSKSKSASKSRSRSRSLSPQDRKDEEIGPDGSPRGDRPPACQDNKSNNQENNHIQENDDSEDKVGIPPEMEIVDEVPKEQEMQE